MGEYAVDGAVMNGATVRARIHVGALMLLLTVNACADKPEKPAAGSGSPGISSSQSSPAVSAPSANATPTTPTDRVSSLITGIAYSRHVNFAATDSAGYTFSGELAFAVGNFEKYIQDTRPGFAKVKYDAVAELRITNTTNGRDTELGYSVVVVSLPPPPKGAGGTLELNVCSPQAFCFGAAPATLVSGSPLTSGTGLVADKFVVPGYGVSFEEDDADRILSALKNDEMAGFEASFSTSSHNGFSLLFDSAGKLLRACKKQEGSTNRC